MRPPSYIGVRRAANLRALVHGTHPGLAGQRRSIGAVADACDMARTSLCDLLVARRSLSLKSVDRLAPVFDLAPAQLLALLDDPRGPLAAMEAAS